MKMTMGLFDSLNHIMDCHEKNKRLSIKKKVDAIREIGEYLIKLKSDDDGRAFAKKLIKVNASVSDGQYSNREIYNICNEILGNKRKQLKDGE